MLVLLQMYNFCCYYDVFFNYYRLLPVCLSILILLRDCMKSIEVGRTAETLFFVLIASSVLLKKKKINIDTAAP